MDAFGPHYPPELQGAVDEAERLAQRFSLPELGACHNEAWAIGRAGEIEQFVAAVTDDWRAGRVGERAAATSIQSYVAGLQGVLRERLSIPPYSRSRSLTPSADEPPTWT
jgi:hypothetical protein